MRFSQRVATILGIVFISILFCSTIAFAKTNSMTLLAVSEQGNETIGSKASLTIELIPGHGRVFLETYPLSKIDTQVSTRLAKEIACQFLNTDCSKYDFIYTIRAGSGLIAGPSAGSSLAAITIATLEGDSLQEDVALSGTINSGGLIGPVGGLKSKIEAASENGITTVLIPYGERFVNENASKDFVSLANNSIDLVEFGAERGVRVIEVGSMYDVMPYVTGKTYERSDANISIPQFYETVMRSLANQLCTRADELNKSLFVSISNNKNSTLIIENGQVIVTGSDYFENTSISANATYNSAQQLLNASVTSLTLNQNYASASYCYGALLNLRFLEWSSLDVDVAIAMVNESISNAPNVSNYKTMPDLQTYMLVTERVEESKRLFERAQEYIENNNTYLALTTLATAYERSNSARAWAQFFLHEGTEYSLDKEAIISSCQIRLEEAQERRNFVDLYLPAPQDGIDSIKRAQDYLENGIPELCLFEASKAKAIFDVLLSTAGVTEENLPTYVAQKEQAVKDVILTQTARGIFPIIGYSYLEYAQSLSAQDDYSALLYLQYALELSNLDAYFPQKQSNIEFSAVESDTFWKGLIVGLFIGLIISLILRKKTVAKNKKK